MAKARVTKAMVEKPARHTVEVRPGERRPLVPERGHMVVWDDSPGMTGFGIRVAPTGRVSYLVRYWTGERERWKTLGAHPRLSLTEAKAKARELLRAAVGGHDPVAEERQAKAERQAAEAQTIEALAAEWLAHLPRHVTKRGRRIAPATVAWYEGAMRVHILPALGGKPVAKVTRRDVAAFHQKVTKDRRAGPGGRRLGGPAVANAAVVTLSIFYGWAESVEAVPAGFNPAKKAPKNPEPKRGEHAAVRLRPEQEGRLAAAIYGRMEDDPVGAAALLALLDTGRRPDEVLRMEWRRLNLDAGTCDLGATKGKRAGDSCYLTLRVRDAIRRLPRVVGNPYVFTGSGKGGRRVGLASAWRAVKAAAGLESISPDLDGFHLYDLRHNRITQMLAAGVSPALVARQVGHTDLSMLKVYGHLEVDDVAAALSRLEPVAPAPAGEVVAIGAGR